MKQSWIALSSLPAGGDTLILEKQSLWEEPLAEFNVDCRILEPLRAEVFVLPQGDGVLFRGRITGRVSLPCDRCSDDSVVIIDHDFDSFESYPPETLPLKNPGSGQKPKGKNRKEETEPPLETFFEGVDEAVIRNAPHGGGVEINPAALAWEEFSLALPVKPLCAENCKGLCPVCGVNKNTEHCSCQKHEGDPRLAALRGLTVSKK